MFVVGTQSGKLYVWGVNLSLKEKTVYKKDAIKVKAANASFSGIKKLPSIKDPHRGKILCRFYCIY